MARYPHVGVGDNQQRNEEQKKEQVYRVYDGHGLARPGVVTRIRIGFQFFLPVVGGYFLQTIPDKRAW